MSRRAKKNAARAVLGAVLLAMALFALLPFVYMGLVSLTQKTVLDLRFDPAEFSFKNYARVFSNFNIGRNLLNSVIVTGGACVLNCIVCAMAAYGFAKKHFPGRDQLFMVYLATLMIPGQVTLIPVFTIIKNLGLMNTHIALMLPILNAFGVFLVRQFMLGLPNEILEAGQMDGAGTFRCLWQVVLPVCRPIIGASVALSFADCWNLVEQPLIYLTDSSQQPLSVMFNQINTDSADVAFAGAALYILPMLLVYLYFQDDILLGVQLSELK